MKTSQKWKNQIGLSFLFTAGFGSILFTSFFFILLGGFILRKLGFVDFYVQEIFYILALAYVIVAAGFGIAAIFTYVLLSPLNDIMDAADRVANGDYSVRVNPHGFGKLQELGEKFNNLTEELDSVETLRNDFINNFSHEFKTPIVSIRGFAKMLERNDIPEEDKKEYLQIIIKESERLSELSTNVLTLTKIEKQAILTNTESFNVSEQIRLALAILEGKWSEKNIEVCLDADEILLHGNKNLLDHVWINLLDNAIKFSPNNETVRIEAETDKDNFVLRFINAGAPIPKEHIPNLFDKFFQGDPSRITKGNGIGLAIVKKVVELHHGEIRLAQSDETQTVFEVLLPLHNEK